MAGKKLSNAQKKELAKTLYIRTALTQKEIAEQVGVSEQSMCKWVKEEKWEVLRKSITTTKSEQIAITYEIFAKMTAEAKAALEDDDPTTNPDYDGLSKVAKILERLEKETNIGEMLQTGMLFINFMTSEDPVFAKQFSHWFKLFIDEQIAKSK